MHFINALGNNCYEPICIFADKVCFAGQLNFYTLPERSIVLKHNCDCYGFSGQSLMHNNVILIPDKE